MGIAVWSFPIVRTRSVLKQILCLPLMFSPTSVVVAALLCSGAVLRACEHVSSQSTEYLGYLSKGQLPPATVRWVMSVVEQF
jgi:hypothetical protein